jgi:alanine dehydrogenase
MIIGIPKEIKKEEHRVAITPNGTREITRDGQAVLIEQGAGAGSGFSDNSYEKAGGKIVNKERLFEQSDLIIKVKEPLPEEFQYFRKGQALFTFLHLAPNHILTEFLLKEKITALGYETLEKDGELPLLTPMSEIAGRIAPFMGVVFQQRCKGGAGVFPPGAVGVKPAKVLILGAGTVGYNAARIAFSLSMETTVLNRGLERLRKIDEIFSGRVITLPLTVKTIEDEIQEADILIGAILIPGAKTPHLITRRMIKMMKKGSVIVDVSVDQGGTCETTHPTTHENPTYVIDNIIHYAVANMPGAYPQTSTRALTNATLPYIKILAQAGIEKAIKEDAIIKTALNTYQGDIVHKVLARSIAGSGA